MKTIFRPFGVGVELSEEEMAQLKQQAKEVTRNLYKNCVLVGLICAEVTLSVTANLLIDTSEMLKDASYVVADKHEVVVRELSYIAEGEVVDCDGQVA